MSLFRKPNRPAPDVGRNRQLPGRELDYQLQKGEKDFYDLSTEARARLRYAVSRLDKTRREANSSAYIARILGNICGFGEVINEKRIRVKIGLECVVIHIDDLDKV